MPIDGSRQGLSRLCPVFVGDPDDGRAVVVQSDNVERKCSTADTKHPHACIVQERLQAVLRKFNRIGYVATQNKNNAATCK